MVSAQFSAMLDYKLFSGHQGDFFCASILIFFFFFCSTELKPQLKDAKKRLNDAKSKKDKLMKDLEKIQESLNLTTSMELFHTPRHRANTFMAMLTSVLYIFEIKQM